MNQTPVNIRLAITAIVAFFGSWLLLRATDFELSASQQGLALAAGLVLFVAAIIFLYRDYRPGAGEDVEVGEPRLAQFLFSSTRSAPLWLGARIYLGWEWLDAGRHKVTEDAWMDGGTALEGYWRGAVAVPEGGGTPRASYGLFREYIQYMLDNEWYTWFAKVIAVGEVLVGIALILGALTGIAAFAGALMNVSFMLAGSVSTNPILFLVSIFIILAWRVAGWLGVDRVLLPILGVPWSRERSIDYQGRSTRTIS
jgi:thiosulfate dehydrogenase [quinone] large subunit